MNFRKTCISILSTAFALVLLLFPVSNGTGNHAPRGPYGGAVAGAAGCGCLVFMLLFFSPLSPFTLSSWYGWPATRRPRMGSPVRMLIAVVLYGRHRADRVHFRQAARQPGGVPKCHKSGFRQREMPALRKCDEATFLACTGCGLGCGHGVDICRAPSRQTCPRLCRVGTRVIKPGPALLAPDRYSVDTIRAVPSIRSKRAATWHRKRPAAYRLPAGAAAPGARRPARRAPSPAAP